MLDAMLTSPAQGHSRLVRAIALLGVLTCLAGCGGDVETRLAEVRALHDVGDFSSSIEPLREILARDPDQEEANYLLGLALVQTKQYSLAIWPLRKAADSEEYGFLSGLLLASTLLQSEGYEEAITTTDQLLAEVPDNIGALLIRIHALLGVGRNEDALEDANRLIEIDPSHFHARVARATALQKLERMDEAEAAWLDVYRVAKETGDPTGAALGCQYVATFYQGIESDKAGPAVATCLEEHPTDTGVLRLATQYYDAQDRPDEATAVWERAVEQAPDDFDLRLSLAQRHARRGEMEQAEAVLEEAAQLFDDASTWDRLAMFRMSQDDVEGAQEANERALERASSNQEMLLFRKADLLVQHGDLEAAEAIRDQLEQDVYRELLRGRLLAARGNDEGALEAFEAGLSRWPNNAGARFMAGQAAERLGLRAKALSHYREAVRTDDTATDAALAGALIQLAEGNWADAATMARRHVAKRPFTGPEAHLVAARALAHMGNLEAANTTLDELAKLEGQELVAVTERAALAQISSGPAEAAAVIEQSGLDLEDPANIAALSILAESYLALGRADEAQDRVDAALARSPDRAELHDVRGRVLLARGRMQAARAAFERALELDPESARAHAALARLEVADGDLEAALRLADRAAALDPSGADSAHYAAQIVASLGRTDEAVERLRALLRDHPGHAGAANDLAWHLAERGEDLPVALEYAERAVRLEPRAEFLDTLGWVQFKRGDAAAAVDSFEKSLELDPTASSVRYRLGLALEELGRPEEALKSLRDAVGAGAFPELDRARAEIARIESTGGATP